VSPISEPGGPPSAPARTVLVDDVDEMRHLLRDLLARDGRFVVVGEARNGEEAVTAVARHKPDVVVLDLGMPVLGGIEALPRIREACPAARIVVLSGYPSEHMEQPSVEGGAVGYVEKSSEIEAFPEQLHVMLSVLESLQHVLDVALAAAPDAPAEVRRALRTALAPQAGPTAVEVVELLTSELVTNAVRYGDGRVRVTASTGHGRIRVAVSDGGEGVPVVRRSSTEDESGRGLELVERLASDWGVEPLPVGKTVWFEVAS
jgi:DNA-binding NarL/FixJ family response regulator